MFKHKYSMVTKTITITEEAYKSISRIKMENESFSDLFKRIAKEKNVARRYLGILKGNVEEAKREARKIREETSKDFRKRENVYSRHISNS